MAKKRSKAARHFLERRGGGDPVLMAIARLNLQMAEQLHDARTAAGLTLQDLAAEIGTSASHLCRLERGDYTARGLDTHVRAMVACGLADVSIVAKPTRGTRRSA